MSETLNSADFVGSVGQAFELPETGDLKFPTVGDIATVAADIGRATADYAAILFALPMRQRIKAMFETEIHGEVAALFGHADSDPAECENCRLVAWLAFDRRLALHARSQKMGGRA